MVEMELPSVHADGDGDGARRSRLLRDYLLALEEERHKIHVFQRELPLCLDLVTHTMEGMRSQLLMMDGLASESEDHGPPVLEEFIPLKPSSLSLCSDDDDDESTHAIPTTPVAKQDEAETKRPVMPDWLQSVQLNWSQQSSNTNKDLPCKPVATKAWGAFHPFDKNKRAAEAEPEPEVPVASSTTAPASSASAVVGDSGDKATSDDTEMHRKEEDMVEKDKEDKAEGQQSQPNRKPRRCWAPELHRLFLQALQQLGGSHVATPKQIRELMKVDGLTNDEVKSHLQKYRLHTSRRPSSTAQSSGATATQLAPHPQFVVVGSCIWVPHQEYAAAAAQPPAKPTNLASGSARQVVYAPVATLPSASGLQPHSEKKQSSLESQGRIGSGNNTSSDSPAVSSSSQTTSP